MRPGEIFALTWGRMAATYAARQAALPEGLLRDIEVWREVPVETSAGAWVFPSERMTPLSEDNGWRRSMEPKLAKVGLGWANFLVLRRTHATLVKGAQGGWEAGSDQPATAWT